MAVSSNKKDAAIKALNDLKQTIPNRVENNRKFIQAYKSKLKNIDGKLFVPTGYEDSSLIELGKALEEAFPGFLEEVGGDIFKEDVNSQIFNDLEGEYTAEEIQAVMEEWAAECAIQKDAKDQDKNTSSGSPTQSKEISQEELEKVADELAAECKIPTFERPAFVPYTQKDVLDALCNIQPEVQQEPEEIKDANDPNAQADEDEGPDRNYTLDDLDKFTEAVASPQKQVVVCTIDADVIEIMARIGDDMKCSTPVIRTTKGIVPAGVKKGKLTKINVKVGDKLKGQELFEIKTSKDDDITRMVMDKTKGIVEKTKMLIDLKESEAELEKNYYYTELQYILYNHRYNAYSTYFNNFQPLVKARDEAIERLASYKTQIANTAKRINNFFGYDRLVQYTSGDGNIISEETKEYRQDWLRSIVKKYNTLVGGADEQIKIINDLTAKIDAHRKGSNFYTITETGTVAKRTEGGKISQTFIKADSSGSTYADSGKYYYRNPLTKDVKIQTFKVATSIDISDIDAWTYHEKCQAEINKFYNGFGIGKYLITSLKNRYSSWDPKLEELTIRDATSGDEAYRWTKANVRDKAGKEERAGGIYHKLRVDHFTFVDQTPDEVKATEQWSKIAKQQNDNIPIETDNAFSELDNALKAHAEAYGHAAINKGKIFQTASNTNVLNSFKNARDAARKDADVWKTKLDSLRKTAKEVDEDVSNLPQELEKLVSAECNYYEGFGTEQRGSEKVKICGWPKVKQDKKPSKPSKAPKAPDGKVAEDLNFRGNPRPNDESPPFTTFDWWLKFCKFASLVNLLPIYWPVGLLIPTPAALIKVPLPVVWIPIVVIPTPICLIVIGIAIAGILPCPWVFVLNPNEFPLGPVEGDSCYLAGAIRPLKKIKSSPGCEILPVAPIVTIGDNTIDLNPPITQNIPFIKDDFPPWERLSITNLLLLVFLTKWCAAGKKGEGFFENPI